MKVKGTKDTYLGDFDEWCGKFLPVRVRGIQRARQFKSSKECYEAFVLARCKQFLNLYEEVEL